MRDGRLRRLEHSGDGAAHVSAAPVRGARLPAALLPLRAACRVNACGPVLPRWPAGRHTPPLMRARHPPPAAARAPGRPLVDVHGDLVVVQQLGESSHFRPLLGQPLLERLVFVAQLTAQHAALGAARLAAPDLRVDGLRVLCHPMRLGLRQPELLSAAGASQAVPRAPHCLLHAPQRHLGLHNLVGVARCRAGFGLLRGDGDVHVRVRQLRHQRAPHHLPGELAATVVRATEHRLCLLLPCGRLYNGVVTLAQLHLQLFIGQALPVQLRLQLSCARVGGLTLRQRLLQLRLQLHVQPVAGLRKRAGRGGVERPLARHLVAQRRGLGVGRRLRLQARVVVLQHLHPALHCPHLTAQLVCLILPALRLVDRLAQPSALLLLVLGEQRLHPPQALDHLAVLGLVVLRQLTPQLIHLLLVVFLHGKHVAFELLLRALLVL
mmetsp:Transcript_29941/g.77400  ORF Transcript_29941/g.77400 Transcript_29941/m.77400 type:complete len:437 (-) Transcript_29941:141-1451(-)